MIFPFTFNINVSGLTNPFLSVLDSDDEEDDRMESPRVTQSSSLNSELGSYLDRRPSFIQPPLTASADSITPSRSSRKRARGWEPAFAEPSWSETTPEYTNGYLDTPAKYRDGKGMAYDQNEVLESAAELPPNKRRRTLADSIISTAISAALIGSAVGLTFYRLWRDRSRQPQLIEAPPPPYQQGNWVEPEPAAPVRPPITPRSRALRPSTTPKSTTRRRRAQVRVQGQRRSPSPPPIFTAPSPSTFSPPPQFAFSDPAPQEEDKDEMDWLGNRLSVMIEEGKKALNREIVVGASHKDDEVDDCSGNWVDDSESISAFRPSHARSHSSASTSRRHRPNSFRRQKGRPQSLVSSPVLPAYSPDVNHVYSSGGSGYGGYRESMSPQLQYGSEPPNSPRVDETWESPELREQMALARARVLARSRRS